jgi:hypothetical protein
VFSVAEDQVDFHEMIIDEETKYRRYVIGHKRVNIRPYGDWLKKSRRLLFDLYAKQLAVKPLEWCYEKEIRLIFHTQSESMSGLLVHYPASAVKSVVLGEKMSDMHKELLYRVMREKYPDIPVGTAIRNRNDYSIVVKYG